MWTKLKLVLDRKLSRWGNKGGREEAQPTTDHTHLRRQSNHFVYFNVPIAEALELQLWEFSPRKYYLAGVSYETGEVLFEAYFHEPQYH